ncbi:hypothetical protein C5167_043871 [Papaver somniferum]|uniref:Uncharacterized protein n=1 Tax=Papaver somniferum TaxID=3469 RepID=A0A4Y7LAK1_PAPSO|nr:hypothetical protein C5167_043871 [Papaver somniferum]
MTISNRFHDKVTTELEWMRNQELSHDLVAEVAAELKDFDCIVAGPDLGRDPHSSGYFLAVLYSKCRQIYTSCSERVLNAEVNSQDTSEEYRLFIKLRGCHVYASLTCHLSGMKWGFTT